MKLIRVTQLGLVIVAAWGLDGWLRGAPSDGELAATGPLIGPDSTTPAANLARSTEGRTLLPVEELPHPRITVEIPAELPLELAPTTPLVSADIVPAGRRVAEPDRLLSGGDLELWNRGLEEFDRTWSDGHGLGAPGFNAMSCSECHHDPVIGGSGGNDFNVVKLRGTQGYSSSSSGGRGNNLTRMHNLREKLSGSQRARMLEEIQTPTLLGLGAIDTIPDEEIELRADPDDLDGDGIRGRVRWVHVEGEGRHEVGRFGWKAQMPRLRDFVCLALGGELGLTAPDQGRGFGLLEDEDHVEDPEVQPEQFEELVFFLSHLAAPERKDTGTSAIVQGEMLFESIGCASCHVPVLHGTEGPVPLYSDLLLHDVSGEDDRFRRSSRPRNADQEPPGLRTPPLWGIADTAPYLHDGSAETLRDAILAHRGEATQVRWRFTQLHELDQEALIAFLEDL